MSRSAQLAGKYGEHAPMATVCCNACRTCVTTNLLSVATAGLVAAGAFVSGILGRRAETPATLDDLPHESP